MTLIGEGMETTRIVCDGEEYVMKFSGNGLFSAGDLAFVHEGPSGVVRSRQTWGKYGFIAACSKAAFGMRRTSAAAMGCGSMGRLARM
jgi:hypothetical protein